MNIFNLVGSKLKESVSHVEGLEFLREEGNDAVLANITVEAPRDASHGDIATNAAMVLAKKAGVKPRDLAVKIADAAYAIDGVATAEVAGPGFINLRLTDGFWQECLADILATGRNYGDSDLGQGVAVNVEYVSANPTGPMHVGHCRGAVFGDALADLLEKVGYRVTREYYINDAGGQIDVLARSAYLRYREALGEDIGDIPEGLYPGDYLVPVGQKIADQYGDRWLDCEEQDWLSDIRDIAAQAMMDLIRDDLAALDIHHAVFFAETTLHDDGSIERAFTALQDKGLIYEGVLDPPKGKLPEDWESRPQMLFRATECGDDVDRPLKKSDGSWTYFAADIAYHLSKIERGFDHMIDVWGADHGGYIKRVKAAVSALGGDKVDLDVKICQLVRLFRDGEPVRMSKRAGTFVTLREVADEVGKDVVRFIMLTRKNDAPLDFDFSHVLEQSRDNPVFYVQYAHARIQSVLRNAAAEIFAGDLSQLSSEALAKADLSLLSDEAELALVKTMAGWPRIVESAAMAHEPHRIAFYLQELAAAFHGLWNLGNDNHQLRFIIADNVPLTLARLALIQGTAYVIAAGLDIMGVEPADEM